MKRAYLAFLIAFCVHGTLLAQPGDPAFDDPGFENENYGGDVSALFGDSAWFGRYRPHFGYRYEAGDTIGRVGGLSSFDAFFPLLEGYDSDWLMFIDARLLLGDDNHNLGSNVGVGARQYIPEIERTIGTYLYYDTRDAGYATFDQVSGGIETLGDIWDARLNWYVPTGQTRNQYATTHSAGGSGYTFVGHHLTGGNFTRYYQAAMKGLDMEAGAKFYTNDFMDLRAYAGWYHFQAKGSQQAWGWKSRVESRISDVVSLNLSVQNDRVFDTTVNFAVGIQWPSITGLRGGPRADLKAWDRLGESPERLRSIVVDNQEIQDPNGGLVIDPSTGLPYFFMHVATSGNSDGSYEDPYATLAAAFADPRTQAGNVIVYDHRNGMETGNFTLATNTQVLSEGPAQFINTQFGQIQLPDSNSGVNPQITGSFTLNNGSVLSGFDLSNSTGSSILANGVGNIMVSNNTITNTANSSGILLQNLTGPVTFNNTTFNKTNGSGLVISGGSGDVTLTNSAITGNSTNFTVSILNTSGDVQLGQVTSNNATTDINVSSTSSDISIAQLNSTGATAGSVLVNTATGSFALNGGTISNSGAGAVQITNSQNVTVQSITFSAITGTGISATNSSNLTLSNNTFSNASNDGINVLNGSGNITISGNTINNSFTAFSDGIDVTTNGDTTLTIDDNIITSIFTIIGNAIIVSPDAGNATVNIRGNQITSIANGFGAGIVFVGDTSGTMNTTISGNTIQNTAGVFGTGIDVTYNNGTATTSITQNTLDSDDFVNLFGNSISLSLDTLGATTSYITQNIISDDADAALFNDGIYLEVDRGTSHNAFINNNRIGQFGGIFDDGIEILMGNGTGAIANVQIHDNMLIGSAGIGGRGLDVAVFSPDQIFTDVMNNTTDTALDFFAGVGGTINITDLPNLSVNNNGATINLLGPGTIQNDP